MINAQAPGKLILCGEHAVVYEQPAIALPLRDIHAHVTIAEAPTANGIVFEAPDLERHWTLAQAPEDPLSELILRFLDSFAITHPPNITITIRSDIPIASGLGSGAAVATALVRALAQWYNHNLTPADISALVYASEQRFHGTPSGIDNTVIAYEQAIWFIRPHSHTRSPHMEPITIGAPLTLVIGDTGIRSATRLPVGEVRQRWQNDPARYTTLFAAIGTLVSTARAALAQGDHGQLGALLNQNHTLLQQLGVSSSQLDHLVAVAQHHGALGAKLSGAGWGGVMLALVTPDTHQQVSAALSTAGATRVLATTIAASTHRP